MTQTLTQPQSLDDRLTGYVVLSNIPWQAYRAIREADNRGSVRMTYDRGLLGIEVLSRHHEQVKGFVAGMIETTLRKLGVDYEPSGSTTWQQVREQRACEADECHHIQHAADVIGKTELDLETDPPPDLAIEIELTPSAVDKLAIYQAMGVGEIWRIRGSGECQMLGRDASGQYRELVRSMAIPALSGDVIRRFLLLREQLGHSAALRRFEAETLRT